MLAGFISQPGQWDAFADEWVAALDGFGVSVFHAKESFPRKHRLDATENPYRDWTKEKAGAFLDSLLAAANNHSIYPIGCAVNLQAFHALSLEHRRWFTGAELVVNTRTGKPPKVKFRFSGAPNQPYRMLFDGVIYEAIDWSKANVPNTEETEISFIFDRQNVLESGAIQHFHELAKGKFRGNPGTDRLRGMNFSTMAKHRPLQIADLFAYIWNARLSYGTPQGERARAWISLSQKPYRLAVYEAAAFPEMLRRLRAHVNEQILATG